MPTLKRPIPPSLQLLTAHLFSIPQRTPATSRPETVIETGTGVRIRDVNGREFDRCFSLCTVVRVYPQRAPPRRCRRTPSSGSHPATGIHLYGPSESVRQRQRQSRHCGARKSSWKRRRRAAYTLGLLHDAFDGLPIIDEVRDAGLMRAVDVAADPAKKRRFDPAWKVAYRISSAAREHGFFTRPQATG